MNAFRIMTFVSLSCQLCILRIQKLLNYGRIETKLYVLSIQKLFNYITPMHVVHLGPS